MIDVSRTALGLVVLLAFSTPPPPASADEPCEETRLRPLARRVEWRHTRSELFTVRQGSARHRMQDVLAAQGTPPWLIGKFSYGQVDKDLTDEEIDVFLRLGSRCSAWSHVGRARTTTGGESNTVDGVKDDGGRLFFRVPATVALPAGQHSVGMMVRGDHSRTTGELYVVPPGTQAVVFDIDGTLTTGDGEVINQVFEDMRARTYVPQVRADSPEVARIWAEKGYLVIYVSGRPDNLRSLSHEWLVDQGFPPGPIHLTDSLRQALPGNRYVGRYKADYLQRISAVVELVAAYGNASTDIFAYGEADVARDRTYIVGKNAGKRGTVALTTYTAHLPGVRALPRATKPAPGGLGWDSH